MICETQRTSDWFEKRQKLITASEVASIMGLSSFETRKQFIDRKIHGITKEPSDYVKRMQQYGIENEPKALNQFRTLIDANVRETGLWQKPGTFFGASPDGIIFKEEKDLAVIEIKCPFHQSLYKSLPSKIPVTHYLQMIYQMYVTGIHTAYYVIYLPTSLHVYHVFYNKKIKYLIKEYINIFIEEVENEDFEYKFEREERSELKKMIEEEQSFIKIK